jgi:hypothetical protein
MYFKDPTIPSQEVILSSTAQLQEITLTIVIYPKQILFNIIFQIARNIFFCMKQITKYLKM